MAESPVRDNPSPRRHGKRRGVRRLLQVLGVLLLILGLLYALAPPLILPTVVRRVGLPELERAFGAPVRVADVAVDHLGNITLTGVSVDDAHTDEPMLEVDRVRGRFGIESVTKGVVTFNYLALTGATIRMNRAPDGTSNLDRAIVGFGIVRGPETMDTGMRIRRLDVTGCRFLFTDRSKGVSADLTDLDLLGWVDGHALQSSLDGRASAFTERLAVRFAVRGSTPGVGERTIRLRAAWDARPGTEPTPIRIGAFQGCTDGEITLSLPHGGASALSGRVGFARAALKAADPAVPRVSAARAAIRPDLTLDLKDPVATARGRVACEWSDASVDLREALADTDLADWIRTAVGAATGRVSLLLSGEGASSAAGVVSGRDITLVPARGSVPITVPEADVTFTTDLGGAGAGPAVADVRVSRVAIAPVLHALRRGQAGIDLPRATGVLQYAAHLRRDADGTLHADGAGTAAALRAGPDAADTAPRGQATFDHALSARRGTEGGRVVRGVVNYRIAGLDVRPAAREARRRWGDVVPGGVTLAGALSGWGQVALNGPEEPRGTALRGGLAWHGPRLDGHPLAGEENAVEIAYRLTAEPATGRTRGHVRVGLQQADAPSVLAAVGFPDMGRRCRGIFALRADLTLTGADTLRLNADLTGRNVSALVADAAIPLETVRASPRLVIDGRTGCVDVERTPFEVGGLRGRVAGRIERDGKGRWIGGLHGAATLDARALLSDLRQATVPVPPDLTAVGDVPIDLNVTWGAGAIRAEGGGRIGARSAVSLGSALLLPAGTDGRVRFALEHRPAAGRLGFQDLSVELPGLRAAAVGVTDLRSDSVDLRVDVQVTDLAVARRWCPRVSGGDLRGRARVRGRVAGPIRAPRVTAVLDVDDVSLPFGGRTGDRVSVSGRATVDGWHGAFDGVRLAWREDEARLGGTVDLTPGARPRVSLRAAGRRIRLSDFTGSTAGAGGGPAWARVLRNVDGEATLGFDRVDLGVVQLDRAAATAVLDHGRLRLDPAAALLEGGGVTAKGGLDLNDTSPVLALDLQGVGIGWRGAIEEVLRKNVDVLKVTQTTDMDGRLAFPLDADADHPWPVGTVKAVCHGGRLLGPAAPAWVPELFKGLRPSSYPFRRMAARAVFEDGNSVVVVVFFESAQLVDMVAEVRATSAGTVRITVGVDLMSSVDPSPALFRNERPYTFRIYETQEAWVDGRRVLKSGGYRSAAEVTQDLLVNRNAVVQELGKLGAGIGDAGLKMLDRFVPLRAIDELLGGRRKPRR